MISKAVRRSPSVNAHDQITYTSSHASYKPATEAIISKRVDVITCLNSSEVVKTKQDGRWSKQLITRVYSMKSNGRSGKLLAHASRFVLKNVGAQYWDEGHQQVIARHSKVPHAWLRGECIEVIDNADGQRHRDLVREFAGGYFIAYNPYLSSRFRAHSNSFIAHQQLGAIFSSAKVVYCCEDRIYAR